MHFYEPARIIQPDGSSLVQLHQGLELTDGSILVNDTLHDAFISQNGVWRGPLGPGSVPINTGLPSFLANLRTIRTGGRIPGINVFFVRKQPIFLPWGTGEILCRETVLPRRTLQVRVLAGGTAHVKVTDSGRFLTHLVGLSGWDTSDLSDTLAPAILVPALRTQLARTLSEGSILDLQANTQSISDKLHPSLAPVFSEMGLQLLGLNINSLSLHPDDLARLQQISNQRIDASLGLEAEKERIDTLFGGDTHAKISADIALGLAQNPGIGAFLHAPMLPTVLGNGPYAPRIHELLDSAVGSDNLFSPHPHPAVCPTCGQSCSGSYSFCPHCGTRRSSG